MKIKEIEIRNDNNLPELYINGKPVTPFIYGLSDIPASKTNTLYAQKNIALFGKTGINLVNIDTAINICWNKIDEPDFAPIREEIAGALQANPDAGIFIRLHMNPPYWWLRDNLDEQIIYRTKDGDLPGIDNGPGWRLIAHDHEHHLRASIASKKWLYEVGEILEKLCHELDGTVEGDAIAGIQLAYGVNGEWHNFGCDVGKPMRVRFVRYLREKYGTLKNLRAAYRDESLTFESVPFVPEDNPSKEYSRFLVSGKDQAVVDSRYTHQLTVVEAIKYFSKIIKESFGRKILTGAFYGYTLFTSCFATGGHLLTEEIFRKNGDAGDIDYICGPSPYSSNRLPDGATLSRAILESCRLNGTLWLTEMDQRPYGEECSHGHPASLNELPKNVRKFFTSETPEELYDELLYASIAQMRRNILSPLFAGHGAWYYDHRMIQVRIETGEAKNISFRDLFLKTGWWEREELQNEIRKLNDFRRHCFDGGYIPRADVLVVITNKNAFTAREYSFYADIFISVLAGCGVAYDCIYIEDIDKCDAERYKCVFFVNILRIDTKVREIIGLRFANALVVHFGENGIVCGESAEITNTAELVGMQLDETDPKLTMEYNGRRFSGDGGSLAVVSKNGVQPFIRYSNGQIAAGKCGKVIFSGRIIYEKDIISEIIRESGARIYSDDCVCAFAAGRYAAVYFASGGKHVVRLAHGDISVVTRPCTTLIFDAESGERIM